jgi:hypothetical protein
VLAAAQFMVVLDVAIVNVALPAILAGAAVSYAGGLLPGLIVFGVGLPLVGVANQIAAGAEVPHRDAAAASGVITTAFQVGLAVADLLVAVIRAPRAIPDPALVAEAGAA